MTARGNMTARQIAAANKREREELAARLKVDGDVAGGPFDADADLDAPADTIPPLPPVEIPALPALDVAGLSDRLLIAQVTGDPDGVAQDLRRRLADAPPPSRFTPDARPRIVDGLIVPAVSVETDPLATWVLIPIGNVATIGFTGRAVGITPHHGRWLPVWVGDDLTERAAVFEQFAGDYATARRHR